MTTSTHRKQTQSFDSERNGTHDARQAGAIARGELATLEQAVLERAADLARAGRLAESKAFIQKHLSN